jgi:outer membrane protein assembly factor BamB
VEPSRGGGARLSRRHALLLPLAAGLSGCSVFEDLFFSDKPPLPGKRIAVMTTTRGLEIDPSYHPRIALPPPFANPDWPQPGGVPSHEMGHLALPDVVRTAWTSDIGEGGGYRRKLSAQPVIANGRVFTMDSDGLVTAADVRDGRHVWDFDTQADGDRSSNVGGGLSVAGATLYAATGRGELIALDAASGKPRWRMPLGTAARAAGTIADGRVFVPTLDDQMIAFAADDGHKLWSYQATNAATAVLGLPSPAYADGIVVGGFGSGDLVALRADSGTVTWTDSLASAAGRNSIADLSTVRGLPVIVNGQVYASSLGGLTLALDLRSGRRLWEREIASYESLCIAGDWIFLLTNDQVAVALARADGRIAWTTQLPPWENMEKSRDAVVWHGPVLAGDRLLFAGTNKQAAAVSPYTGKILGTRDLPDIAAISPVVAGGTAFIVTDDGSLVALR